MVQFWICKLKGTFKIIPPRHFTQEENEAQRGDLTYLKSHTSTDALLIWPGFLSHHTFPLELVRNSLGGKPTWGQSNSTECYPPNHSISPDPNLSPPTDHTKRYTFSFPREYVHRSGGLSKHQLPTLKDSQTFSLLSDILNCANRTLARPAQRLFLSPQEFKAGARVHRLGLIWTKMVLILLNWQWVPWRFWSSIQVQWGNGLWLVAVASRDDRAERMATVLPVCLVPA